MRGVHAGSTALGMRAFLVLPFAGFDFALAPIGRFLHLPLARGGLLHFTLAPFGALLPRILHGFFCVHWSNLR